MLRSNFLRLCQRAISLVLIVPLVLGPNLSYAQSAFVSSLPEPGAMVGQSASFVPVMLKGMTLYPDNPLRFDFIVDSGNTKFAPDEIRQESNRLVKYFLAAMTVPQNDLWVNLSPYEADRVVPDELGKTELGQDMLAQDYILKQLASSLLDPEEDLGKEFWARVYAQAQEKFGSAEIPVDAFNKVWIMPEEATVYENGSAVYVIKSRLKVMLDQDYRALQINKEGSSLSAEQMSAQSANDAASLSSKITRELILPQIEREVNEGKNFAPIRQIYQALILAKWYKETVKESLLSKVYIDQKKIKGVDLLDPTVKDQIYGRYVAAFKKGVINLIREDYDAVSQQTVPRKYFSGGEIFGVIPLTRARNAGLVNSSAVGDGYRLALRIEPQKEGGDNAMVGRDELRLRVSAAIENNMSQDILKFFDMQKIGDIAGQVAEKIASGAAELGSYDLVSADSERNIRLVERLIFVFKKDGEGLTVKATYHLRDEDSARKNMKPIEMEFRINLAAEPGGSAQPNTDQASKGDLGDSAMGTPVTDFNFITYTDKGPQPLASTLIKGTAELIAGTLDKPLTAVDPNSQGLTDIVNNSLTALKVLVAKDYNLGPYFSSLLKDSGRFKAVSFRVSDKLGVEIATLYSAPGKVDFVLSKDFVTSLLANPRMAELSLAVRIFHELGRPHIKSFYQMYRQEYELIKKDFLLYKILLKNSIVKHANFPRTQRRMLAVLNSQPIIIGEFDKLIYAIETLERAAEKVFKDTSSYNVGETKNDPVTLARDGRIEEAFQIADPDFHGDNPSKSLNRNPFIKGTFLGLYAQILGQRGIVQGRESFLFLADAQVTRIPFNQFKDPRVPENSRTELISANPTKGLPENRRWGRQYYALHYGRRFADGIGVTEAENGRGMQQRWHVHETTQEYTTSLSDNTSLRFGHKLIGGELKAIDLQLTDEVKGHLDRGEEVKLMLDGKERTVLQVKDENGATMLIVEDTEEGGRNVPFASMIAMPKGTFHTLKNSSNTRPSIDFTVKDAVTQILKTFSPPNEVQITKPQVIKPFITNAEWGGIYEHIYQGPYNSKLAVNISGEKDYYFDEKGNPIPKMYNPVYMKLRIVEVKPGQTTSLFNVLPLDKDEQMQAIRFFPWPREIPADDTKDSQKDWLLDRDHKQITAEVKFYNENNEEIPALSRNGIQGGDMVLVNNEKRGANDAAKHYSVTNRSEKHSLVFFVVEPSDTIKKLLPYFNGDINLLNAQVEEWKSAYEQQGITKSTSEILAEEVVFVTYKDGSYFINERTSEKTLRPRELSQLEGISFKPADFAMANLSPKEVADIANFDQFLETILTEVKPWTKDGVLMNGLKAAYRRYNADERVAMRKMLEPDGVLRYFVYNQVDLDISSDRDNYDIDYGPSAGEMLSLNIIPFGKLEEFLRKFKERVRLVSSPEFTAFPDDKFGRRRAYASAWGRARKIMKLYEDFWSMADQTGLSFEDAETVFETFWNGEDRLIRANDDVSTALFKGLGKKRIAPDKDLSSGDSAMKGGVDMNQINVNREGAGMDVKFDPAMMQDMLNHGVDGFAPVIINFTPIGSFLPILGLKESELIEAGSG